jgi:hypothetical protein
MFTYITSQFKQFLITEYQRAMKYDGISPQGLFLQLCYNNFVSCCVFNLISPSFHFLQHLS